MGKTTVIALAQGPDGEAVKLQFRWPNPQPADLDDARKIVGEAFQAAYGHRPRNRPRAWIGNP